MTQQEFAIIKEAHSILDRLTDDKTIMDKKDKYSHLLSEGEDGLLRIVFFIEANPEKLIAGK